MASSREYPERPVVGIGGVMIEQGRALLIRRGSEPLRGNGQSTAVRWNWANLCRMASLVNCWKRPAWRFAFST